jgi:E3 ubiquitin-protein ligase TRIP12
MLEVGFDGEVGTGFGPTLEFYSTLSRELQKFSLKLWHGNSVTDNAENGSEEYVYSDNGLYPLIHRQGTHKQVDNRLKKFEFFGRLLGQALIDSRMLDIPLSSTFFKWLLCEDNKFGPADLEVIDPVLYKSLRDIALMNPEEYQDLEMYFTFPGDESFELCDGGKKIQLTKNNLRQFVDLICYWRLNEGVRMEMEAVRRGFDVIVDRQQMKIFTSDEMEELFCGCSENGAEKIWAKNALQQAIRPDHGYTHDSPQIGWLIDMLHGYPKEKRRQFLQFVTGSPRLPVGGFRALNPPLTVVRKTVSYGNSENELPSAMTCYNYLKIPPYATFEAFVERFDVALQFIYSFHLT